MTVGRSPRHSVLANSAAVGVKRTGVKPPRQRGGVESGGEGEFVQPRRPEHFDVFVFCLV
jgi:hypothetical protein